MNPSLAAVIISAFVSGTAAWAVWLRFRSASQSSEVAALRERIERMERQASNVPALTPFQMPHRMGAR